MHLDDEHFLVIGAVEDADVAAFGQVAGGAPEKIVRQFLRAGMLEAEHLAALRIDAGHDVLDRAVLARGVHRLKNQQQRITIVRVEQILVLAHFLDVGGEQFFVMLVRFVNGLTLVGNFLSRTWSPSRTRNSLVEIFMDRI